MSGKLIGRKKEQEILLDALNSSEAEMVSLVGRRRVGKTFLVTSLYQEKIVFELTGIQNASRAIQLRNFRDVLTERMESEINLELPIDWLDAFNQLKKYLKPLLEKDKKVIFLDELPWMATHKSGFLEAFGYFWNSWASRQNLVVVICGSAASWMIQKVVRDKGSLHNRITKRINLQPFNLKDTEQYLLHRRISFERYQLLHLYMVLGGVPHYLKEIKRGYSAAQNIDELCFSNNGLLKEEFENLYTALFKNAHKHIEIVRILAGRQYGMSRDMLIKHSKMSSGKGFTKLLEELTLSGFISAFYPFGNKKTDLIYRLTDEFSLFYFQFMDGRKKDSDNVWKHLSQTQSYKTWSGYAFENICLKHIYQIKLALKIAGVYSTISSFYQKGGESEKGSQIDLVLDRNDHVINLFEIKFYQENVRINKAYAHKLREKAQVFRAKTKTRKQIFWTLMTTFGLDQNHHSLDLIDSALNMDILFE